MKRFALCASFLLALIQLAAVAGQDAAAFRDRVQPFVEAHCIDCHGPDVQKAGLRLDILSPDLADEADFARWVRVHDKVSAGEMPPPDSDSLPKPEAEQFAKWLRGELHAASLARQQSQG